MPTVGEHLTAENYVDQAIYIHLDNPTLVGSNQDIVFNNFNLTNINSSNLNTHAFNDIQVNTKSYVDQFHQENEQSRPDSGIEFYKESSDLRKNNRDNDFNDNKLTDFDSITANRNPRSNNEFANKSFVDDPLSDGNILKIIRTLENFLDDVSETTFIILLNLIKKNTDTTITEAPNNKGYLLQRWNINCNDKNGFDKIQKFLKSTKTNSTGNAGATNLRPIGDRFMYIETNSINYGPNVLCSFERTDIIQITNITFCYNRFSISINDSIKSMGRFRIQLLLKDNT